MVPEIRSTTNRIFSHFVPFIALLYGVNNPENQKFWKNIIVKNKGGGGGFVTFWFNDKQMKNKEWLCGLQKQIKMWKNFRQLNIFLKKELDLVDY